MSDFPALIDLQTGTRYPLDGRADFLVGRKADAQLPIANTSCSREHFRLTLRSGRYHVEAVSPTNLTYCDSRPVERPTALVHGAVIQAGECHFRFVERDESAPSPVSAGPKAVPAQRGWLGPRSGGATAEGGDNDHTLLGDSGASTPPPHVGFTRVTGILLIGREKSQVQVHLDHPTVSRMHARLEPHGGVILVSDLRSANGTFVNGRRVLAPQPLRPNDRLDIGPYSLVFDGDWLRPQSRSDNIELVARRLKREVADHGGAKTLLDDISLVVRPHEFICLLGPSGAGKSTLLAALSGRERADHGEVLLNRKNLYANFDALKQDLVVVPQREALHEPLTVEQTARYTARLRLPADTTSKELAALVEETLATVGLTEHRQTRIGRLSGGQRRRMALACELLGRPTLLFLDEVTSGLDEQTDREMMRLFRALADAGKTVVCVTHSLANVERYCHLVVLLAQGGKLAFVGKPAEALQYFKVARLGDVYEKLLERTPAQWQEEFASSPTCGLYLDARMPPEDDSDPNEGLREPPPLADRAVEAIRQAALLSSRYAATLWGDRQALVVMAGQALLVACLLILLFGDLSKLEGEVKYAERTVRLLFLLNISCFWFGCNNAAKEIVKEQAIYRRESMVNLKLAGYYGSKLGPLAVLTLGQVGLAWGLVVLCCRPPMPAGSTLLFLSVLSLSGMALGLAVSAVSRTEDVAITLVPVVLLPQIILAGGMAPLSGASLWLARCTVTCFWGYRGLAALPPQEVRKDIEKYWLLDPSTLRMSVLMVAAHGLVFLSLGAFALWIRYRSRRAGP